MNIPQYCRKTVFLICYRKGLRGKEVKSTGQSRLYICHPKCFPCRNERIKIVSLYLCVCVCVCSWLTVQCVCVCCNCGWAWVCPCLSIFSVVWNLSQCLWLLLLGSSPVEFVVKMWTRRIWACFSAWANFSMFEADGCLNSSAKAGLVCFFAVEKWIGPHWMETSIQCSGCVPFANCETGFLASNSLARLDWRQDTSTGSPMKYEF